MLAMGGYPTPVPGAPQSVQGTPPVLIEKVLADQHPIITPDDAVSQSPSNAVREGPGRLRSARRSSQPLGRLEPGRKSGVLHRFEDTFKGCHLLDVDFALSAVVEPEQ